MGATVIHLSSLVKYFQVSVVDQVLVLGPRDPPVLKVKKHFVTMSFSIFVLNSQC